MEDWERKYFASKLNKRGMTQNDHSPSDFVDVTNRLKNKLTAGMINSPAVNSVYLSPGSKCYRNVNTDGFGSTVPIARECGLVPEQMKETAFVVKGTTRAYVIDNETIIDFALVSPDSPKLKNFVIVEAPFIGKFMVDQQAIIGSNQQGGKQILKG